MTPYHHKLTGGPKRLTSAATAKYRLILFAVVGLTAFVFLTIQVFTPFSSDWRSQSTQIREKSELIKQYEQLLKQEDMLSKDFESLSKQIQAEIPVEREESQFLTEIEKVASGTYVHISTMNPQPFKDFGSFKELSVEIEMEANLGNLARFLYYIKKSSVVLVANRLSLQPKSERSALLKGHLVISTIFLKDK